MSEEQPAEPNPEEKTSEDTNQESNSDENPPDESVEGGDTNDGSEPSEDKEAESETPETPVIPSNFRNYISFVGFAISIAALVSLALLFLLEITGSSDQPYLGILIFILFPAILIFGLAIAFFGALYERRRRRRVAPTLIAEFPVIDLNDPRRRRSLIVFLVFSFAFLFASAFGSYQAYEFTESQTFCGQVCHTVMQPEFLAYNAAPHARVKCVECHVGGGADAYAQAKFSGVRQLVKVTFGTYDRPIHTPVRNMRPARETCAKCHWPDKFHGDKLRVITRFSYDEQSSPRTTRMLVKVGGKNANGRGGSGIHWHMNLENEVTYIASDENRQKIPWVQLKRPDGTVIEYVDKLAPPTAGQIAELPRKKMDCIDCHNRPTHQFMSPNNAVDRAILDGRLDRSLPFVKRAAVGVLSKPYSTTDEALNTIDSEFREYYKTSHSDVFSEKQNSVNDAVLELHKIYRTYFFPEMKTDWQTHPDNIGHFNTQGCFRCHDGRHVSKEGEVIRSECNVCHTTVDQTFGGVTTVPEDGKFKHPANLGEKGAVSCASCHKGDRSFKHPVNLGDISRFSCTECHQPGKF